MGAHSVFGPSGSVKWLNCPGSINAEKGIPDTTSEFAQEGTDAHELSEICLKNKGSTDKQCSGIIEMINIKEVIS